MNYKKIILHGLGLAAINLSAMTVGSSWDAWIRSTHPTVAQTPVTTLLCVLGFIVWYYAAQLLSSGKLALSDKREWCQVYGAALLFGPILLAGNHYLTTTQIIPFKKIAALLLFQISTNILAAMGAYVTRSFDIPGFFRSWTRSRWFSNLLAICVGCLCSIILLFLLEGVFYILNSHRPPTGPKKVYDGVYLQPGKFFQPYDKLLGVRAKPNTNASCKLTIDGKTAWDVIYSTDEYGRRITPVLHPEKIVDFALFFGCSYMFGEGLPGDKTLAFYFGADSPNYKPIIYALPGWGPQQMLAKLQSGSIRSEVSEPQGILIYLYLEDIHEARAIGAMDLVNGFAADFPYYKLDKVGRLYRKGNFTSGRPIRSKIYALLGKSQIVRYFRINFPGRLTDRHYQLTAKMIEESRNLFEAQFKSKDFYVVFYPKPNAHKKILPYLSKAGINVLDYSGLFDPAAPGFEVAGDGHPTAKAFQIIAKRLAEDIAHYKTDNIVTQDKL